MVWFIGYEAPLDPMPMSELLDGDIDKILTIDRSFPSTLPGSYSLDSGKPIQSEYLPTAMIRGGGRRGLTDNGGFKGFKTISSKFKDIVERLEPDVHQFFPIKILNRKKEPIADHWIWVICNRLDSVDREHTKWVLRNGRRWDNEQDPERKLVFNDEQIGGCHFWRDKHFLPRTHFCSDAAKEMITAANLTGIKLYGDMESV